MLSEDDLGGSKGGKDDILDFERKFFHTADRILNASANSMHDMKIRFQFGAQHTDWVEDAVLSVHMIMLNNGMKKNILGWNAHFARIDLNILNILLINLIP